MEKPIVLVLNNLNIEKNVVDKLFNNHNIIYIDKIEDLKSNVIISEKFSENKINTKIIDIISNVVEFRNLESGNHVKRIKTFTNILAKYIANVCPEYKLDDTMINMITSLSALHDVGKIVISDNILLKNGKLTTEEFEIMKTHTTKGCEILDMLEDIQKGEEYKISHEICKYHHERYDGNGYPEKLKGKDIPIAAQIVSIADVYDALVHERVYKKAFPVDKAYNMIINGECGTFSPNLLKCFCLAKSEFEKIVLYEEKIA